MNLFLSATYFPFTFISPSLVEAMSLCFHRVVLYQPAHPRCHPALQPWINKGFLDLRSPFEKAINKKPLEAALRDFSGWGRFHQHADMSYLKTAVDHDVAPFDPEIARIASEIKETGLNRPKKPDESGLSIHLFLHLAQEFDQHSWELEEELNRINQQYDAFQGTFRQDQDGEAQDRIPISPSPSVEGDLGSVMIDKRMAAWNRLFQKDPIGSGLLITNSHTACDYLLDDMEEKHEILKLNITFTHADLNEVPKAPPTWVDHLREVFHLVFTLPWDQVLQERLIQARCEIERSIEQTTESNKKSHDRSVSFRWYVVPGQVPLSLLNRCCDVKIDRGEDVTEAKNTVVGLVQESRTTPL